MKTLIVSWHGLGDNVILTPVLRMYKELTGEEIYLAHLRRLPVQDVLDGCPYLSGFVTISDVWNDFPSVEVGRKAVMQEAQQYAKHFEFEKILELTLSPSMGITHKIHRACHELGIPYPTDYRTEIFPNITEETKAHADRFLSECNEPYIFAHIKTGNSPKDLKADWVYQMLGHVDARSVIEYGSNELLGPTLPLGNIPLEIEILKRCSRVFCADSFIMHAAYTLGIPTTAVFLTTPPAWVVPMFDVPNFEILMRV